MQHLSPFRPASQPDDASWESNVPRGGGCDSKAAFSANLRRLGSRSLDRSSAAGRSWVDEAIRRVDADANRSADTHLHVFPLPESWGVDLYLKDESVHPTGSLKHRLARSLFLYGLCNGWIGPETTIVEASSGSTAVSRGVLRAAARPAVRRRHAGVDQPEKIALIEFHGGRCHLVDDAARDLRGVAPARGRERRPLHGPVHPRRARDRLARQQQHRRVDLRPDGQRAASAAGRGSSSAPAPAAPARRSAATSATAATRRGCASSIPRTPPSSTAGPTTTRRSPPAQPSRIEGIGRPRVEPSFMPGRDRPHDPGARRRLDRRHALRARA